MYKTTTRKTILSLCLLTLSQAGWAQTQTVQVLEYHPAPGQFVNVLPTAKAGTTQADINRLCEEQLEDGNLVHLGTYGGYITMKFDHPIVNKYGSDFLIKGNGMYAIDDPKYGKETIGGSIEPGIVYVGVGDNLETAKWYELAGSEYYTSEIHDFEITYFKPTAETCEHQLFGSVCDNYIKWNCTWTNAQGERRDSTGYHMKNQHHLQTYWPQWEGKDQLTFKGGCLPNNAVMYKPTYWVQYRYAKDAYGYADACPAKDSLYSSFDINWAVDERRPRGSRPYRLHTGDDGYLPVLRMVRRDFYRGQFRGRPTSRGRLRRQSLHHHASQTSFYWHSAPHGS